MEPTTEIAKPSPFNLFLTAMTCEKERNRIRSQILKTPLEIEPIKELLSYDSSTVLISTASRYRLGTFLALQRKEFPKKEYLELLQELNLKDRTERKYRNLASKIDALMEKHEGDLVYQNDLLDRDMTEICDLYLEMLAEARAKAAEAKAAEAKAQGSTTDDAGSSDDSGPDLEALKAQAAAEKKAEKERANTAEANELKAKVRAANPGPPIPPNKPLPDLQDLQTRIRELEAEVKHLEDPDNWIEAPPLSKIQPFKDTKEFWVTWGQPRFDALNVEILTILEKVPEKLRRSIFTVLAQPVLIFIKEKEKPIERLAQESQASPNL